MYKITEITPKMTLGLDYSRYFIEMLCLKVK